MRMFSKESLQRGPPRLSQNQVRKAEDAGHLSLKDRGPMCSLKVSKDEREKRAKGRVSEREREDVPMSALS